MFFWRGGGGNLNFAVSFGSHFIFRGEGGVMQTPNRIVTFLAVLCTIFAFDRASFAADLKMYISAYCWTEAEVTGVVTRIVIKNMQMVVEPCWSGPMTPKITWVTMPPYGL